jgi:tetratricopeptide (TPR) repeat protein/energy-coupling factor transporter ATP-binding protein EcfA2
MPDLTPHEVIAHEAVSLPVMIPPKLIGRDVTVGRLYSQLKENKPVLLYGAAGVGKTALAATLASAMTQAPGGVLWINVDQPSLADIIVRAARAYRLHEVTTKENPLTMINTIASTIANQRPLVVLDGSISADVAAAFIAQAAPKTPVLIVCEDEIGGAWTSIRLGKLEPEPAAALLRQSAGLSDADAAPFAKIIAGLAQALDFQPFALTVAGATMRAGRQSPAEFVNFLAGTPNAGALTPNQLALATAQRALDVPLRGLLIVLAGMFSGGASAELIGMIGGVPEETVNGAMNLLIARGLVERFYRYDVAYYRLHPLVVETMRVSLRAANNGKGLDDVQTRARDTVVAYARKYSADPDDDGEDKLSIEMDNIIGAAKWAAARGERQLAESLATMLARAGSFAQTRGYVYEIVSLQGLAATATTAFTAHATLPATPPPRATTTTASVAAPTPPPTPSPSGAPTMLPFEDTSAADTPDDDADLPDYEAMDDLAPVEMTDEDAKIGLLFDSQPIRVPASANDPLDDTEALDPIDDDELDDESGSGIDIMSTLSSFGVDETTDDDLTDEELFDEDAPDESEDESTDAESPDNAPPVSPEIARLRTALAAARQSGDARQQAALLASIGMAHMETRHDTEAISSYTEALTLYESLNDSFGMLSTLEALANLTARGDGGQAVVMYATRGISLAKDLGREEAQARLLVVLGDARQQSGDSDQAARVYGQALDLRRTAGDERDEAAILLKLGYSQLDSGEPDEAIQTWEDALTLFRQQDRRDHEGKALGGIGTAYGQLERWTEAINFHQSALHIAREVKDKDDEALQLGYLGYAASRSGDKRQAVLRYRQALHLAYQMDDRQNIVGVTVDLAGMLVESPRHLDIAALLVDAALAIEPHDRDLRKLSERIDDERDALGDDPTRAPVTGSARDYAANAYRLLEE